MLTKEELRDLIEWDDHELGHCKLYVPLFDKELDFLFIADIFHKMSITSKMAAIVNDILQIPSTAIEKVKDLLWEECLFSFEVGSFSSSGNTDYSSQEAYLEEIQVGDKEAALQRSIIRNIVIDGENDKFQGRYAEISMDTPSDKLISLIIKDGRILDFDYNGFYLGSFDKHEDFARKHRTATLNQ